MSNWWNDMSPAPTFDPQTGEEAMRWAEECPLRQMTTEMWQRCHDRLELESGKTVSQILSSRSDDLSPETKKLNAILRARFAEEFPVAFGITDLLDTPPTAAQIQQLEEPMSNLTDFGCVQWFCTFAADATYGSSRAEWVKALHRFIGRRIVNAYNEEKNWRSWLRKGA